MISCERERERKGKRESPYSSRFQMWMKLFLQTKLMETLLPVQRMMSGIETGHMSYPWCGERLEAAGSRPSTKVRCNGAPYSTPQTHHVHTNARNLHVAPMTPKHSQRKCFPFTSVWIQVTLFQSEEVQKKCLLQGTEGVKLFRKYTERNRLKIGICSP